MTTLLWMLLAPVAMADEASAMVVVKIVDAYNRPVVGATVQVGETFVQTDRLGQVAFSHDTGEATLERTVEGCAPERILTELRPGHNDLIWKSSCELVDPVRMMPPMLPSTMLFDNQLTVPVSVERVKPTPQSIDIKLPQKKISDK